MDVVIPCHPKDYEMLNMCIAGLKDNITNVSNVYIISPHKFTTVSPDIKFVCDAEFPFSHADVKSLLPESESGVIHWYFQQLAKMYAPTVIPNLSENFLVLDADVVILKPISFFSTTGAPRFGYTLSDESDNKYTRHFKRLNPKFILKDDPYMCAVCDFQVWNKNTLKDLVEDMGGWKKFLEHVTENQGASEYEMYFHYYTSTRKKPYELMSELVKTNSTQVSQLHRYKDEGYHVVSFHHWMGPRV